MTAQWQLQEWSPCPRGPGSLHKVCATALVQLSTPTKGLEVSFIAQARFASTQLDQVQFVAVADDAIAARSRG